MSYISDLKNINYVKSFEYFNNISSLEMDDGEDGYEKAMIHIFSKIREHVETYPETTLRLDFEPHTYEIYLDDFGCGALDLVEELLSWGFFLQADLHSKYKPKFIAISWHETYDSKSLASEIKQYQESLHT